MSDAREQILSRVKQALAPLSERAPNPQWSQDLPVLTAAKKADDLWTLFAQRLKAVNGLALEGAGAVVAHLRQRKALHGYCDPALWPGLQAAFGPDFTVETVFDRTRVDDYQFGLTRAAGAIAETGSLILTDRGTSSRLAALAPWIHIAVVKRTEVFRTVGDAVAALGDDPNVIWVTGPSKTADVEGILIEGVHGPGEQIALLVD
jgi:L-lactate dehydrogenase complex protein LldG